MKTKLIFVVVIALVIVVVAGVLLMSSHVGSPTNEKIEIPANGADVSGTPPYWTSAVVTVHNTGTVSVEIATIYVQGVAYTYSPVASPGKFSAASNQIAAGQSVTFTITPTKPVPESGTVNFKVVTQNGAEADGSAPA